MEAVTGDGDDGGDSSLLTTTALFTLIAGVGCVLVFYVRRLLRSDDGPMHYGGGSGGGAALTRPVRKHKEHAPGTTAIAAGNRTKKKVDGRWGGGARGEKQHFAHPWLLTTLKGHGGPVLDMDYSSNGKYLASCGEEDLDPGGPTILDLTSGASTTSSNSSSNLSLSSISSSSSSGSDHPSSSSSCDSNCDSNKENSRPSSTQPSPRTKGLSRRQRKNRRRDDTLPPDGRRKNGRGHNNTNSSNNKPPPFICEPLKQSVKLNLLERDLTTLLRSYLLSPEQMLTLGYPIECGLSPGKAIIFKSGSVAFAPYRNNCRYTSVNVKQSRFDVNAQEFVPGMSYSEIKAEWKYAHHDSGQGSGSSSDSGELLDDSEESSGSGELDENSKSRMSGDGCIAQANTKKTIKRNEYECVRCGCGFLIANGAYVTQDKCLYHWGKLQKVITATNSSNRHHTKTFAFTQEYACCRGRVDSRGCTTARVHVWNGIASGFNGPLDSYVRTRPRRSLPPDGNFGVYALDCEMCYTSAGLELTKITVVGHDGRLVYDSLVQPDNEIVDYNTRWSGITAKDLGRRACTKTLREVQNDLMGFINADTILIGHGLENDLRALRLMHCTVIDTAVAFPHHNGLPYRRSLKSLTSAILKREIQMSAGGHNSYEDARACLELMLWRVRKDFRTILEHYQQIAIKSNK